jgi:DNA-binding MarR family transcriptional regulator
VTERTSRTVDVWASLLRAHAAIRRSLGAHLKDDHGLTVNQYAALLLLSQAEGHRMRPIDLAERLELTRSGVSRLLGGLHENGFVEKSNSLNGARTKYAVLTDAGQTKIERASCSDRAVVRAVLAECYSDQELDTLIEFLGRLGSATASAQGRPRDARASRASRGWSCECSDRRPSSA